MKSKSLITLLLSLLIVSCNQKAKNLEIKLNEYVKTYETGDYVKMSSFVLPSVIQSVGGAENFANMMNALPETFSNMGLEVDMKKIKFGTIGKITERDNFLISVVPTTLPIKVNGQVGSIKSCVIAFSEDKGETWFFIEGNDEGKSAISNTNPDIIQSIDFPIPELNINGKTLVQKGGQWIKK